MYNWKWGQELLWAVLIAVSTSLLQVLVDFDPAQVADWKLWAISLGAGSVRAAAVALLAMVGKAKLAG